METNSDCYHDHVGDLSNHKNYTCPLLNKKIKITIIIHLIVFIFLIEIINFYFFILFEVIFFLQKNMLMYNSNPFLKKEYSLYIDILN